MSSAPNAVTIVVPAYNVERYLAECLDSLVAQSVWPDCRVIVVDDGSTDATPTIADGYAAHHPSISVLRQANAGPGAGAARNHGLDTVNTEFVLFVDGDDELASTAIEHLRAGLLAEGLDLAVGATEQFPEPRSWIWSDYFVPGQARSVTIEEIPLLAHDARTCNKLYRTSWLRALGLRFAEGIHHQDTVVNVPAMLLAERFFLVGDVVHRYRKRAEGGSVMDSHYTRNANFWDHLQVIEELNSMRPRFRESREPLMQAFIARSFQGFSWRAPEALPADRLSEFFTRAGAVIRTVDPDVLKSATRNAAERIAYAAMLEDDFASFQRLPELGSRLEAHDGDLYLGVPVTRPDHRRLLRTGATRALANGVTADRNGVLLSLRLRLGGVPQPDLSVTRTTLRGMTDEAPSFVAQVEWTTTEGSDVLGRAFIPWSALTGGEYRLRLKFNTATGSASRWVRRPSAPELAGGWIADDELRTPLAQVTLGGLEDGVATLSITMSILLTMRRRIAPLLRPFRRISAR